MPETTSNVRDNRLSLIVAFAALVVGCVWVLNYSLVARPVAAELAQDSRNSTFDLSAHYRLYIDPTTLVLDLREGDEASPIDLLRGFFQSARVLQQQGRTFNNVLLAHRGTAVFRMKGDDFASIGRSFEQGENPIYLARTLPEKLYSPSGDKAFGHWEGGLLGVVGNQIEDVNAMTRTWVDGK